MQTIPPETRKLAAAIIAALFMAAIGYLYGRNSARKDQMAKIAKGICAVVAIGVGWCLIIGGRNQAIICLGGGFLAGFAIGVVVIKRSVERFGDSIEADQFLNVAQSERVPRQEHPCIVYLKAQDEQARKVINKLRALEIVPIFAGMALAIWLAFADVFSVISRSIFVRPGDGTLFFIPLDSIIIAIPLMLLSIIGTGLANEYFLPRIAGEHADVWLEFRNLRSKKSRPKSKFSNISACAFVFLLVIGVVLFMDTYVKVTDGGVAVNGFLGIGSTFHPWSDIREVSANQVPYYCKDCGKEHLRFEGKVVFKDGSEWKPDTSFARRASDIEKAILYIKTRTGK